MRVTWDRSKNLTFTMHLMHLIVVEIHICFTLLEVMLGLFLLHLLLLLGKHVKLNCTCAGNAIALLI